MTKRLRLALTADLHWGTHESGDEATRLLVEFLRGQPPDVLALAGDIGAADDFGRCLANFDFLTCHKVLVPGNHDIWVRNPDDRGDSLDVYRQHLPRISAEHGFHYLDGGPLLLPEAGLALVGTMNWYDYSWTIDELKRFTPDWEDRLRTKRFSRGRHNDARFVRWPVDDVQFAAQVVEAFAGHLQKALGEVRAAIAVAHHPPIRGLNYPRPNDAPSLDGLLWEAFSGNRALEAILTAHADRIPFVFCGHTHMARENQLNGIRGYNIGGDYHFKRLLMVDWPSGQVEAHVFGLGARS